MTTLLLAFGAFVTFFIVGFGLTTRLRGSSRRLSNALLAPALGTAALVAPTWAISHIAPVETFAVPLVVIALGLSTASLIVQRCYRLPLITVWFGTLIIGGIIFAGSPALVFPHWLSLSNDDALNYMLNAQRLLHQKYLQIPDTASLIYGRDQSLSTWFLFGLLRERTGGDLLLALVTRCSGRTVVEAYMPTMLALQAVLISTGAAFALTKPYRLLRSLLVASALTISPLVLFGTILQLLGQAAGLPLFIATIILILDPLERSHHTSLIKSGVLLSIAMTALLISYYEMVPIALVILGAYSAWSLYKRRIRLPVLVKIYGIAIVVVTAFLNTQLIYIANWLAVRVQSATASGQIDLFPQYRLPSGFAYLWGLAGIYEDVRDPWLSLEIAAGAILLFAIVAWTIATLARGRREAYGLLVFILLAADLMRHGSGFGLFKLAMYVQVFLWTCLIGLLIDISGGSRGSAFLRLATPVVAAGIFFSFLLNAHQFYIDLSSDMPKDGVSPYGEVAHASSSDFYDEMQRDSMLDARSNATIVSDAFGLSLMKYQAEFDIGHRLIFAGTDFLQFQEWQQGPILAVVGRQRAFSAAHLIESAAGLAASYARLHPAVDFDVMSGPVSQLRFKSNLEFDGAALARSGAVFWHTSEAQTVLNNDLGQTSESVVIEPLSEAKNVFVPIDTPEATLIPWAREHIGLSKLEIDPWFPHNYYDGVGRYLLMEVVGYSAPLRVRLDITNAFLPFWELPRITLVGKQRYRMNVVGGGSASLMSPEILPQRIAGHDYILLEVDRTPSSRIEPRTGLMRLYGKKLLQDGRQLTILVRGLWAAPQSALKRPVSQIAAFPTALRDRDLVYSGIDEYGQIGNASYIELQPQDDSAALVVAGTITQASSKPGVVTLDGLDVGSLPGRIGPFSILHPITPDGKRHLIAIRQPFSRAPSARLSNVGYYSAAYLRAHAFDIVPLGDALSLVGAGWYDPETSGGLMFRWVNTSASIFVRKHQPNTMLHVDLEAGPTSSQVPRQFLVTDAGGRTVFAAPLQDRQSLNFPLGSGPQLFTLSVSGHEDEPLANDPRRLSFRVFNVRVTPETHDDILRDTPAQLAAGWDPPETYSGERFRWLGSDAVIEGTLPKPTRMLVEVGPGIARPPLLLSVLDGANRTLAHVTVTGRQWITLPPATYYHLRVDNGGALVGTDRRVLNLRAFTIEQ